VVEVLQDEGVAWSLDFLEPGLEVLRTLGLAGTRQRTSLTRSLFVVAKSGTSWDKRHVYPAFETTPHFVIFFEELHQCHYSIAIAILKRN
jgi:hypothetical protein